MPYPGPGPALSLCSALCLPPASARAARAHWTEDRQDGGGTHRQGSRPRGKVSQPETRSPGWGGEGRGDSGAQEGLGGQKGIWFFIPSLKKILLETWGAIPRP